MKKIISLILCVLCLFSFASCKPSGIELDAKDIKDVVEIEMSVKGFGIINLDLYHDVAPVTVENFVKLATDGFYDGLTFHRVVADFMIQGGDPNGDGTGGSKESISGEFILNGYNNPLSHKRGVISMARSQSYDSASSQFFICNADSTFLDGQYAAFGEVTEGLDVVDKISAVEVDYNSYGTEKSVPKETITIDYVIVTGTRDRAEGENAETGGVVESVSDEELYKAPVKVEMAVKDHGTITLELYPNLAPITVENFVTLAKNGFYDGLTFHRIVSGFMIQGGDPDGTGMGGSEKKIKGEFLLNGISNPLSHERGVISMARSSSYDSASSQFFICHGNAKSLDNQYAAFGKVIDGMDVVDSVAGVEVEQNASGEKSAPTEKVFIEYVKVLDTVAGDSTPTDDTTAEAVKK